MANYPNLIIDSEKTLGIVLYGAPRFPIDAMLANKLIPLTDKVKILVAIDDRPIVPFQTFDKIIALAPNDSEVAPHALVQYAVTK